MESSEHRRGEDKSEEEEEEEKKVGGKLRSSVQLADATFKCNAVVPFSTARVSVLGDIV